MKHKPEACTYCGEENNLTKDHIPPKCLFQSPKPQLITVPACQQCNLQASKDDEYFKAMLAMRYDTYDHPDVQGILPSVIRSYTREEASFHREALFNSMSKTNILTPSGLYLGKAATYDVDLDRLGRVVERTVRGLYLTETGKVLPIDSEVKAFAEDGLRNISIGSHQTLIKTIIEPLYSTPPKTIGEGTFQYWAAFAPDVEFSSAWILTFYERVSFIAITLPCLEDRANQTSCRYLSRTF